MAECADALSRARLALRLLAIDPAGLGGLWLRARPGPVCDHVLGWARGLPTPLGKIFPGTDDATLLGGIDVTETLASGYVVKSEGLLSRSPALLLGMAERTGPRLAAHLGGALDERQTMLIALDEGTEEEAAPAALIERLAFAVDLTGIPRAALMDLPGALDDRALAPGRLADLAFSPDQVAALTVAAARLGIESLRAPVFALAAARAHAALADRAVILAEDLSAAARLVYAHRARIAPDSPDEAPDQTTQAPPENAQDAQEAKTQASDEMIVEAARAALPEGLLASLATGRTRVGGQTTSGSGDSKRGLGRGRPLPSRPGRARGDARIDIIATLRAAAPWQRLRRSVQPGASGVLVRREDIRVRTFEERTSRLLIFTVDASGSAAVARLAEAKGAVEILLSEAYARRDHVALVAFRGKGAEMLLPPTRSLVQAKRRLQALPGGGGTPLASGLMAAFQTAKGARGKGMTPTIAVLTDGRGNVALDGRGDRKAAAEDADDVARLIRGDDIPALVIDTGARPQPGLKGLSETLDAPYLPMPRADAERLGAALRDATTI
ncbi:MAG: magnesium chelatase subunit D [Pseudomonadota bacterium]